MDNNKYIIAEFDDGLQLIPAAWYNVNKLCSIWPSHLKTKLRINKAIVTKEMPRERSDWEELPIKKVFGIANTYEEGLQKLIPAEETSNVDDTVVSSNEFKEREKKRRRLKARKQISSSSEDLSISSDKENYIQQDKRLPALPQKNHFVSIQHSLPSTSGTQNTRNVLRESTSCYAGNSNILDPSNYCANNIISRTFCCR